MNSLQIIKASQSKDGLNKITSDIELMAKTPELWLPNDGLKDVIIKIRVICISSPALLDGNILGLLAKRLLNSETEVGGPYDSSDDTFTNILIAKLFRSLGSPLEKLEKFLENKIYTPSSDFEKDTLSLFDTNPHIESAIKQINKSSMIAKRIFKKLNSEVGAKGLEFLNKIEHIDKYNEISSISSYVMFSLRKEPSDDLIRTAENFGVANLFAWIAYTIYDDFIDDEGNPHQLSLANITHRLAYDIYLENSTSMKEIINTYFNSVDNSNLWELQNCRFKVKKNSITVGEVPNYRDGKFLANRAVGHLLGPKILLSLYSNISNTQAKIIHDALCDYLISKQINDDLHDWRNDLRNGHISFVVAELLKKANIQKGDHNIDALIENLEKIFWESVFEKCAKFAVSKISNAQKSLKNTQLFTDDNVLDQKIINPIKYISESSLKEYFNGKMFLNIYSSST